MSRRSTFRESDITRTVKAVRKAGLAASKVEVEGSKVTVWLGDGLTNPQLKNPWDKVLTNGAENPKRPS